MRYHQMMELKRRKNQNTKGMRLFIPILFVRCLRTLDDNLWANFDSIDQFFFCCPLTLRSVCDPRNTNLTPRKAARKCRVDLGQGSDDSGRNESRNINGRSLNAVISIHLLGTGHTTFRSDESTEMASPERPIDWNKTPHTKFATGVKKPVKCVHLVSLIYWAKELCGILCGTPQFWYINTIPKCFFIFGLLEWIDYWTAYVIWLILLPCNYKLDYDRDKRPRSSWWKCPQTMWPLLNFRYVLKKRTQKQYIN